MYWQARLYARLPRLSRSMADRPLVHFTLNVFVMGLGLKGAYTDKSDTTSVKSVALTPMPVYSQFKM
jgi:hypothetical protein